MVIITYGRCFHSPRFCTARMQDPGSANQLHVHGVARRQGAPCTISHFRVLQSLTLSGIDTENTADLVLVKTAVRVIAQAATNVSYSR